MSETKSLISLLSKAADEGVTVVAILALVALGMHGSVDPVLVGAVSGLGGYRLKKRHGKQPTER